jgi:hypothetical protein
MTDAVALAAAIGGPAVGIVTVVFAHYAGKESREQVGALAKKQHGHERILAHDARLYESRSRVYEDLLADVHRDQLAMARTHPIIGPMPPPPPMLSDEEYLRLTARVAAFGSPEVLTALEAFTAKVRGFFAEAHTYDAMNLQQGHADPMPMHNLRQEAGDRLKELEGLVRHELTAPP